MEWKFPKKAQERRKKLLTIRLVYPTRSWRAATGFHSCSDCPLPLLSWRHATEQWWIPVYHRAFDALYLWHAAALLPFLSILLSAVLFLGRNRLYYSVRKIHFHIQLIIEKKFRGLSSLRSLREKLRVAEQRV